MIDSDPNVRGVRNFNLPLLSKGSLVVRLL